MIAMVAPLNLVLVLVGIAVGYSTFSILLQRKFTNVEKNYESRTKINKKVRELMALSKQTKDKDLLMAKQKELNAVQMEGMKYQSRALVVGLVMLPLYFLIYSKFLPMLAVSLASSQKLLINIAVVNVSYQEFFIIISVIWGLVISGIFYAYDKKRFKGKYDFSLFPTLPKEHDDAAKAQAAPHE